MLDIFKSKKSLVRQALEQCGMVRHTWFEWALENEALTPILCVEYRRELDPAHPHFDRNAIDVIRQIVSASDKPHPTVRIIPVRAWD